MTTYDEAVRGDARGAVHDVVHGAFHGTAHGAGDDVRGDASGLWGPGWDLVDAAPWLPAQRVPEGDVTPPVLVGLDGGAGGETALEWALRHARDLGAPVRAVTAWSWDARVLHALTGITGRTARPADRVQQAQEEQLARVLRRVGPAHCRIDTVLGEGDAASLLLEESRSARLLVVGNRTEPGRPAVGSVARACARLAACPVVVVPVRGVA